MATSGEEIALLEFLKSVKADDGTVSVSVFADAEKGHTVYVTHTGAIVIAEGEKRGAKTRAAGFAMGTDSCAGCEGC